MEFNAFDHILMNLTILTNFNEFYDFVILNDFEWILINFIKFNENCWFLLILINFNDFDDFDGFRWILMIFRNFDEFS